MHRHATRNSARQAAHRPRAKTHSSPVVTHLPEGITPRLPELPAALSFGAIVPNPVADRATPSFALPRDGAVRMDVLDVQGRLVQRLCDALLPAGEHRLTWDGRARSGRPVGSGVYFAVLRFGEHSLIRRVIWMP